MRILGIDPGTYNMGVGIVDSRGSRARPRARIGSLAEEVGLPTGEA